MAKFVSRIITQEIVHVFVRKSLTFLWTSLILKLEKGMLTDSGVFCKTGGNIQISYQNVWAEKEAKTLSLLSLELKVTLLPPHNSALLHELRE